MSKEFEVYIEYAAKLRDLLANLQSVLSSIKRDILERAPNAKMYIFGSVARGDYTAASDIDVPVVVSSLENVDVYGLKALVKKRYPGYPIEVHITDKETFRRWYMRFIREEELIEV